MSSTAPKKDTAVSAEKPEASVVSEKTKNIVDASEEDDDEEPEPTTDIYVRLYNDDDKDYCFVVKLTDTVESIYKIFDAIPFCLSPNYFHYRNPVDIKISRNPGFLTTHGGLLFTKEASQEKYLDSVSKDAVISEVAWDGQLFIPIWHFSWRRYLTVIFVLSTWLYLDFPQYLNPTPGYAPTMLMFKLLELFFPSSPEEVAKGVPFNSPIWQWVFFILHVIKVSIIFAFLKFGVFNPSSFNPFKKRAQRSKSVDEHLLKTIGWTANHRATVDEWRTQNSRQVIKELGIGMAHHNGTLGKLRFSGIYLTKGEGFAVKKNMTLKEREVFEKERQKNPDKFYISDEYYQLYYTPLAVVFSDPETDDNTKAEVLAYYRRFGPKKGDEGLNELFDKREKLQNLWLREGRVEQR